jgi:hypothetical protein
LIGSLIVCPSLLISIISPFFFPSTVRVIAQTNLPVFLVIAITFTQLHHLFWLLYSSIDDIFHIPFSDTTNTYSSSSQTIVTCTTSSSGFNFIHLTQLAALHIGLTSSSENCIALPSLVAIKILSSQEVVFTQDNSSHSFTFNTINQLLLIFLTKSISSFLTVQALVTNNKFLFFSSVISSIAAISSSF